MRVIGGHDRGRRLRAPRGLATRPTADRVRVTLFDVLGPTVAGARVLDLFAGTGAVGIEALSRGAARVVLVERDQSALRALRANLAALGAPRAAARVMAGDVLRLLPELGGAGRPVRPRVHRPAVRHRARRPHPRRARRRRGSAAPGPR